MEISKNKIGISIIILCFYWAGAANASTFLLFGGETGSTISGLPNPFDPSNEPGDIVDDITIFDSFGEGVILTGAANLTYTYIGKEAGSTNAFLAGPSFFLTESYMGNLATDSGSTIETSQSAGFLDFSFVGLGTCCVDPGSITNGFGSTEDLLGAGYFPVNDSLAFAVSVLSPKSLYLMFGDGYGDSDFDDMVVRVDVSAVPVPAAFWLFGTALIGFIGMSRRTKV